MMHRYFGSKRTCYTKQMPKNILVVEDSPLLRAVVRDTLEKGGFTVVEAENGQIGLDIAIKDHPDLIMLDLMMPVMDGMTMFKKLREDEWGAKVPVIMLTGTEETKITSWTSGEQLDFLKKENWMMDEVIAKVKNRLNIA